MNRGRWSVKRTGLVGLATLSASCSLLTATDRGARVEVDPVVRQRLFILATSEWIENETVQDPAEVACAASTPRTCIVSEYVRVTVTNRGFWPIFYEGNLCPIPIERFGASGWSWIEPVTCLAYSRPVGIGPGETEALFVFVPRRPEGFDWRTASDELRVTLHIWDRDGALPLESRVSEPFRLRLE